MEQDPDYDELIRTALAEIARENHHGRDITGLAEWLVQLAEARDALRRTQKANGKVITLRRR